MNLLQRCPSSLSLFVLFSLLSRSLALALCVFLSLCLLELLVCLLFGSVCRCLGRFKFRLYFFVRLPYFGDILVYIKKLIFIKFIFSVSIPVAFNPRHPQYHFGRFYQSDVFI